MKSIKQRIIEHLNAIDLPSHVEDIRVSLRGWQLEHGSEALS